jgi:phage shock protein A
MQNSLDEYETAAHKLSIDIEQSEMKLSEMRQKHTIMRARQSTSSALNAANRSSEDNTQKLLDSTFDRWEVNIVESELTGDTSNSSLDNFADSLEQDFLKQENRAELSMELEALLKEKDHE